MKGLTLLAAGLLFYSLSGAQSLSWFHGDWTGETYFPNGSITKRIIIKLRVLSLNGNHFEAVLDNLYPNDTTVRLERKITGRIMNKQMRIESSELTYIRDPRTQNFWRDCTGCDIQSAFSINNNQVIIQLKTTNCNDDCNGETTFSRDTSRLDSSQKKDLAKWLDLPAPKPLVKKGKPQPKDSSATAVTKPAESAKTGTPQKQKTIAGITLPDNSTSRTVITKPAGTTLYIPVFQNPDSSVLSPPEKSSEISLQAAQKRKDTLLATATGSPQTQQDSFAKDDASKADSIPGALTSRTTNLITTYQVSSSHIIIQLFDNAEIDGDVVTVYHNGQLIVNRQSLTHKPITIAIDASKTNAHHEFIMVADNLGLIPPNTALMRITAGEQKFELEVSSDFDNNSKIAVDYTGE